TYPISDRKLYAVLVREAFSHRRKTLKKALQNSAHVIGKDVAAKIIANAPEDLLKKRAEELTLKEWAMLTDSATATNRD
ncbi:MAG: 16S rRNA (adenine(1518)-N(6)/adenine(1519)-N(6))-dimethyltransferase, partial [Methanomicrobium sp.]|nr:16S rRNA (adenine(1518)-N(6)/adenine(1519)-N(6))-dimethyltransferase [Methanomicrobium sp.]